MKEPDANAARFVGLWRQIAEHYRNAPEAVCFELLNEPHDKLTADKWNALMPEALAAVRATNPTREVVIEGADWASGPATCRLDRASRLHCVPLLWRNN